DKVATFWAQSEIPYRDLLAQSSWVASQLRDAHATAPGDRVGIWLRNRPEFIPALFGIFGADAVAVPINCFLKPAEVAYLVHDAQIRVLITEDTLDEGLKAVLELCPGLSILFVHQFPEFEQIVARNIRYCRTATFVANNNARYHHGQRTRYMQFFG
ncbi:MAG: hypothetical protein EBZ77_12705, partial [Chitinophagia bacterium]|nr:hypothetical protein [Chitinophagia bacterium]